MNRVPEVLKLLKALQFEMASAWHSMWKGMLQETPVLKFVLGGLLTLTTPLAQVDRWGRAFSKSSFLHVPSVNRSVNCIQRYIATNRVRRGADRSREGYRLCQSRPQSNAGAQDQGAH